MCLCAGTGRYRVSAVVRGAREIVSRPCDCEAGMAYQFGIGRAPEPPKSAPMPKMQPPKEAGLQPWQEFVRDWM
jgi:hypothetical protein